MQIIPAIDMMDGKCVRLVQGKFDKATIFSADPTKIAIRWESEGAKRIHLVDLNGSRFGKPQELSTIKRIIDAVNIPVQLGGGIRTIETAKEFINIGVDRVIIGTSAALDETFAKKIFTELGENVILGIDAKDGFVAVKGWEELTKLEAVEFAIKMQGLGAKRIIYTDISRDGMMAGVNLNAMKKMAESLNIPVIASGGVTTIKDLHLLSELGSVGIEGAIVGKALYKGSIKLSEATQIWM